MTDDRAEFTANRDAGLVKRHEQRLARATGHASTCPVPCCGPTGEPVSDMVIPPDRERLVRAAAYALYLDRWHGDPTEGQFTHERYDDAEQQAIVAVDAVLALLPTEAETKALVETATRLGRELGRREAAEEIVAKADGIAEGYAETARIQRDLSIEKGFAGGESNMRTAIAFRNKADGAWMVAHIAREIATKEPK